MSKILLVPSAKLVPAELQMEFGAIPSAMVPLDNRPALHYIAEPYIARGFEVIAAVHQRADHVATYLDRNPELRARTVDVGETTSLGHTVLAALECLAGGQKELVVNFGDTFVRDDLGTGDFIAYEDQEDIFRWTTFRTTVDRRIVDVVDKDRVKDLNTSLAVFVGVFGFADPDLFCSELRRAVLQSSEELDPFYVALTRYFNGREPSQRRLQRVVEWWDFGHLDTYNATKREYFINTRAFNRVEVDSSRGVVRKTSSEPVKLISEIRWYLTLPKELQHLPPRIFDYSLDVDSPFVEMEFYGYPAMSDIFLYGDYDPGVWSNIFQAIGYTLETMGSHQLRTEKQDQFESSLRSMYEGKTRDRLASIVSDERFRFFCQDEIYINDFLCPGLPRILADLEQATSRMGLHRAEYFTIIHGDLCLSNILYDRRNSLVRLVDPRGSFGTFELYGDPRYDLAKLCHSIEGDYDFLVNGLFDIQMDDGSIRLLPHHDGRHRFVKDLFHSWIRKKAAAEYPAIKLIEGLLFLSMVPLHDDRFRSQQAFLARGIETFARAITEIQFTPALESAK